ncbi:MAG: hypothetical protein IT318_19965, partial [Anaerolineales bacterium]|nr:hypothetical protein [Anaerolineales bacterium]
GTEPDQLGCGACGAAFNVEAAGQRVRLVRLPPALAVQAPGLLNNWLLPIDIPDLIERAWVTERFPEEAGPALSPSLLDELLAAAAPLPTAAPQPAENGEPPLTPAQLDELAAAVAASEAARATPGPAKASAATAGQDQWAHTVRELLYGPAERAAAARAQAAPRPPAMADGQPASGPASASDLAPRAQQLYALGNPIPLIRSALERTGAAPEVIAAALAEVAAQDDARRRRHARTYRWVAMAAGLLVLVLAVAVALVSVQTPPAAPAATAALTPGQPAPTPTLRYNPVIALINLIIPDDVEIANGPRPTPGPTAVFWGVLFPPTVTPPPAAATARGATQAAAAATAQAGGGGVPDWVRMLLPDDLALIAAATPSIERTGPGESPCPLLALDAAALFGGDPADWEYNREHQGWIMILVGAPVTLRVPANMSVGYLAAAEPLELRSELGPVTVANVNFAAVSCGP